MRLPLSLTLVAAALVAATAEPPAEALACAPTPDVLSRHPVTTRLAGGARLDVFDTGPTKDPDKSVRVAVVRYGPGAPLRIRAIAAGSLTTAATPGQVAARNRGVLVAVDGGFFVPRRRALPTGPEMIDGWLRKASTAPGMVIAVLEDGNSAFGYARLEGTVAVGNQVWPLAALNHQAVAPGMNLYTAAWGAQARPAGAVDVVVSNGRVVEVRTKKARGKAPRWGQDILTGWGSAGEALARLHRGDPASWTYRPVVTAENGSRIPAVRSFIGTGGHYVRDGHPASGCSARGERLRPRTAIGWTGEGGTVIATFNGRSNRKGAVWGGATNHQVGEYMARLGAVESVSLDGGTSTSMVVRTTPGGRTSRIDRVGRALAVPETLALEYAGP